MSGDGQVSRCVARRLGSSVGATMAQALLLVRIVLAATFSLAGIAKLLDPSAAPRLSEYAGLPQRVRPVVRALPVAELAVAAGLLVARTSRPTAAVMAGMLAGFSVLVARRVASHDGSSCGCFGRLDAALLSQHPLVRNAALFGGSLFVVAGGAGLPLGALGHQPAWLATLLVLLAAVVSFLHLRRRGGPRRAFPGPRELAAGAERTVVAFLEPGCAACRSLLPVLQRFDEAAVGARLVLVTGSPIVEDPEFRAAARVAARHLADRGALAARYGISTTPAAVVLSRRGSLERVVFGAPGVQALLEPDLASDSGLEPEAPGVISRRRLLAVGLAVASALPRLSLPSGLRTWIGRLAAATGVTCPSCGSCVVCDAATGSSTLQCRPCVQHCSGLKLCKSFANEFPVFTTLAHHLRDQGFSQDGEMVTHGLERASKLIVMSGSTSFTRRSASTPRAVLIYSLVDSGQIAWAALLDAKGAVRSVAAVVNGLVVTADVTPPPASAATAGPSTRHSPSKAGTMHAAQPLMSRAAFDPLASSPYSCGDVCSFAVGIAVSLLALPLAVISAPETAALGFAASLFAGGIGLANTVSGAALSALLPLVQSASLVNGVIDGLTGLDNALGQTTFCEDYACKLLKFCCNYSGHCNESDAQCEHDCPGGLAHPMAHCDAYLDGKRVSSLIAP